MQTTAAFPLLATRHTSVPRQSQLVKRVMLMGKVMPQVADTS